MPATGPRDLLTGDALGGMTYWARPHPEIHFPIPYVPDNLGISGAVFADAGSLFGAGAGGEGFERKRHQPCRHRVHPLPAVTQLQRSLARVETHGQWTSPRPVGPPALRTKGQFFTNIRRGNEVLKFPFPVL